MKTKSLIKLLVILLMVAVVNLVFGCSSSGYLTLRTEQERNVLDKEYHDVEIDEVELFDGKQYIFDRDGGVYDKYHKTVSGHLYSSGYYISLPISDIEYVYYSELSVWKTFALVVTATVGIVYIVVATGFGTGDDLDSLYDSDIF